MAIFGHLKNWFRNDISGKKYHIPVEKWPVFYRNIVAFLTLAVFMEKNWFERSNFGRSGIGQNMSGIA
ncbi:MAG: hypothetical protein KUF82_20560 [Candidatus Thiodiazotropha sp. (ex Ctena orbiculata)]|nr:hypothetical protein [Candidatus Thiodiazotropha taylori]